MTVLSQQNDGVTAQVENTDVSLNCGNGNNARICSLPRARKNKILEVRQQLIEGRYDIDGRLNVALDHLLENLIAKDSTIGDYLCPQMSAC
ncbi:MAG: hypothetical protein ABSE89_12125 [Sedimentisphaerales bacterium]